MHTWLGLFALGSLIACTQTGVLPPWLAGAYTVASLVSVGLYARDKRAARRGLQRTPERTLQGLAVIGGWPGALLAQGAFRHKNRKAAFQRVFWLCVVANIASVAVLLR
ncbi:DUF1294 domain-containing protein [Xanthomonas sp. 60]